MAVVNFMKKVYLPLFIMCSCAAVVGCAAKSTFIQMGNLYPPYDGPVLVLYSPPIDAKYEEIGLVYSSESLSNGGIDVLKKEAATKGANAIVILTDERPHLVPIIEGITEGRYRAHDKSGGAIAIKKVIDE